jgi:hypothetical protein
MMLYLTKDEQKEYQNQRKEIKRRIMIIKEIEKKINSTFPERKQS